MRFLSASILLAAVLQAAPAPACDELAGRLLANAVRPAIESLGCGDLAKAGLDRSDHHLDSLCYSSSGPDSSVDITASLTCKTSDAALIKSHVSENVSGSARVRASDCQILELHLDASGEIGKIMIRAFDAEGAARRALQDALEHLCAGGN